MSMHSEPENFEQLRRLLALKRHEQPPPGYFNHFSRDVLARIRAGEAAEMEANSAHFLLEFPFLQRLWTALEARPVLAGALGVALCGFLTAGFLFSDNSMVIQTPSVGVLMPEGNPVNVSSAALPASSRFLNSAPGLEFPGAGDSVQVRPSLFHPPQGKLINFTLPSGD